MVSDAPSRLTHAPNEPASVALRRRLAGRRLTLEGASTLDRWAVTVALAVSAGCGLLLLSEAVPLWLPGGRVATPTSDVSVATLVPTVVLVMTSLGLTCAAALLGIVAVRLSPLPRTLLLVAAALPGLTVLAALQTSKFHEAHLVDNTSRAVMGATLVVVAVAAAGRLRNPVVLAVALGLPWAAYAVLLIRLGQPDEFTAESSFTVLVALLAPVFSVLLAWQVFEGLRGSERVADGLQRDGQARARPVLAACAAVLGVLVLGIAGALPAALGGGSTAWQQARNDNWLDWLLAAVLAALIVAGVLLVERTPDSDHRIAAAVIATIAAYMVADVATSVTGMTGMTIGFLGVKGAGSALSQFAGWQIDEHEWLQLACIAVAGAAGAFLIWRRPRFRAAGLGLLVFAVWAGPTTFTIATNRRDPSVSNETMTTTLVAALVIVTAVQLLRRRRVSPAVPVMLVVFGAIAFAQPLDAALSNATALLGSLWFYVALVGPAAYRYLGSGHRLRPAAGEPTSRLLIVVAATVATLSLAMLDVSVGTLTPDNSTFAPGSNPIIRAVFAVPIAVALVAVAAARYRDAGAPQQEAAP